ncbi:LysE family translocator [Rhodophyticola porphyridii]|uniref:LysE family translocator n=1 Tax=Rhodophyticola porphyridii TaxID=1852017 RepID=A0A3L9Y2N2_9RHOB|nr:LysE family translocator [Rhodophyticola porphyridii]RMA43104.1 LysE family translocator [Rhodophyticola porphyridii]
MTSDLIFALALFAFVSSITPGPNNLMLMASGANFGIRRTIPHMLGVALGFVIMALAIGVGLIRVFDAYPVIYDILKVISIVYLLYLAWKIGTAVPILPNAQATGTPLTFLQAAGFQWVNPKALSMALTAITVYTPPGRDLGDLLIMATVFGLVNLPSVGSWAWLGLQMRRFLTNPARLRAFNITAAGLLVASLYPILMA